MDYPDKRGEDFWDYVDERLAYLRKKAETAEQLVRCVILNLALFVQMLTPRKCIQVLPHHGPPAPRLRLRSVCYG